MPALPIDSDSSSDDDSATPTIRVVEDPEILSALFSAMASGSATMLTQADRALMSVEIGRRLDALMSAPSQAGQADQVETEDDLSGDDSDDDLNSWQAAINEVTSRMSSSARPVNGSRDEQQTRGDGLHASRVRHDDVVNNRNDPRHVNERYLNNVFRRMTAPRQQQQTERDVVFVVSPDGEVRVAQPMPGHRIHPAAIPVPMNDILRAGLATSRNRAIIQASTGTLPSTESSPPTDGVTDATQPNDTGNGGEPQSSNVTAGQESQPYSPPSIVSVDVPRIQPNAPTIVIQNLRPTFRAADGNSEGSRTPTTNNGSSSQTGSLPPLLSSEGSLVQSEATPEPVTASLPIAPSGPREINIPRYVSDPFITNNVDVNQPSGFAVNLASDGQTNQRRRHLPNSRTTSASARRHHPLPSMPVLPETPAPRARIYTTTLGPRPQLFPTPVLPGTPASRAHVSMIFPTRGNGHEPTEDGMQRYTFGPPPASQTAAEVGESPQETMRRLREQGAIRAPGLDGLINLVGDRIVYILLTGNPRPGPGSGPDNPRDVRQWEKWEFTQPDKRMPETTPMEDPDICKVCFERERRNACVPCGHYMYCNDCSNKIRDELKCPHCRGDIYTMIQIKRG